MTIRETFWEHYTVVGECWEWNRSRDRDGYGRIGGTRAHRVAWALTHGITIPKGGLIRHTCDNPACINPEHLRFGSQGDNMRDRQARGPWKATPRMSHCKWGHPLRGDNLYVDPAGRRVCRACRVRRVRACIQRKREAAALLA
jgi:hypothetical protein